MAVAAPVLERNADTQEREYENEYRDIFMTADERHNSRISENYARLINPESRPKDIIPASAPVQAFKGLDFMPAEAEQASSEQQVVAVKPYLVENARADADIFRADSPVNRRLAEAQVPAVIAEQTDEEENEDLRPTQTTIQYKTAGVKKTAEEGKIQTKSTQARRLALTKKDKIIIAVALTVIIALFVLIIVNSAVISNLSSDAGALRDSLAEAEIAYNEAVAEKNVYLDNIEQIVNEFAIENGMILR